MVTRPAVSLNADAFTQNVIGNLTPMQAELPARQNKAGLHVSKHKKFKTNSSLRDIAVKKLKQTVSRAVKATVGEDGAVFLVRGLDPDSLVAVQRALERLPEISRLQRRTVSEEKVERLLAEFLPETGLFPKETIADNAAYRADFLSRYRCLTAADIHARGNYTSGNRSMPASRWKAEGKVLAIPCQGEQLFPAFQFDPDDGRPLPVIARILAALPREMSPWGRAFWFVAPNGWLDGAKPVDRLADATAVIAAATTLATPHIG